MFENFANVWTIVGLAKELKRDKPLSMTIASERVVFFRDASGAPAALIDRCPHRGVALSLGCVSDGEIECPFHGWRFSGDGSNLRTPWNPDSKTRKSVRDCSSRPRGGGLALALHGARTRSRRTIPLVFAAGAGRFRYGALISVAGALDARDGEYA